VLYVSSLSFNLLSVGQLYDLGLQCLFNKREVIVTKEDDNEMVLKGFQHNNLYLVDFSSDEVDIKTCLFTKTSLGWLWHRRLAHVGMGTLKKLMKKELIRGLKDVTFEKDKLCSACQAGKQVANTHPTKAYLSTSRVLELLHMDLFGPTTYASPSGNKYCLCNTPSVSLHVNHEHCINISIIILIHKHHIMITCHLMYTMCD